jgi:hypothetical protein
MARFIVSAPDEPLHPYSSACRFAAGLLETQGHSITARQLRWAAELFDRALPDLLWVNRERTVLAKLFQMDNALEVARRDDPSNIWGVPEYLFLEKPEEGRAA